jgi:hypothetical protein
MIYDAKVQNNFQIILLNSFFFRTFAASNLKQELNDGEKERHESP